jgi:hypothetical protein
MLPGREVAQMYGGAYQDFPILHFHLVAGDRS